MMKLILRDEIITVLNIDPMVAYTLKEYTLKGVALSKNQLKNLREKKLKNMTQLKFQQLIRLKKMKQLKKLHLCMVFH